MDNPPAIALRSVLRIAPTFRLQWEKVQNCYVVLYPEGMVKLSDSAGEIMKRLDGETSVGEIVEQLAASFASTENIEDDVLRFLELAYGNGWISEAK